MQRKRVGAALSAEAVAFNLPLVEAIVRKHLASWQTAGAFDLEAKAGRPLLPMSGMRTYLTRPVLP